MGLGIVSLAHFVYDFSTKIFLMLILLTDQISLSGCLYLLKYWAICALQWFVNQVVMSKISKSDLSNQAIFIHEQKCQDKNLNILRRKRACKVK